MSLTQEQIEKLASNLAKIKTQNKKLPEDLNNILKYIDMLEEVDTSWVQPTISVISDDQTILRNDILAEDKIQRKELLECSNQKIISDQIAIASIMQ